MISETSGHSFLRARNSRSHERNRSDGVSFQIYHRQYTRKGLESQHSLVVGLILPGRAMDDVCAFVLAGMMAMDMASDKNIRNGLNHHRILRLGGQRRLAPP